VPALEDKIVQGATVMVLNAIYEGDFVGFSYGFQQRFLSAGLGGAQTACFHCRMRTVYHGPIILETV
jgi:hypothetical protein